MKKKPPPDTGNPCVCVGGSMISWLALGESADGIERKGGGVGLGCGQRKRV